MSRQKMTQFKVDRFVLLSLPVPPKKLRLVEADAGGGKAAAAPANLLFPFQ